MASDVKRRLVECLRELHLPTFREQFEALAHRAVQESLSYEQFLLELADHECQARRTNRIERWLRESGLPLEKSLARFDMKRLPAKVARQARTLLDGAFVDARENVLAFGRSGSGKTHLLCGIAQELVPRRPTGSLQLVQPARAGPPDRQAGAPVEPLPEEALKLRGAHDR